MVQGKVEICGVNTAKLPLLKAADKDALFAKIREGDTAARESYIEGNLRLVLSVIKRFSSSAENVDDLFQIGCIGLIKAIDNFDSTLGVKFSTYAVPMIIGEIRRYLRDNNSIRVSRSLKDTAYKAIYAKDTLTRKNLKEPTVEEIAAEVGISKEDIVYALDAMQNPMSLYEPVYTDGGDTLYVMDQISDKKNKEEMWVEHLSLSEAMKRLNDRERHIISLRFFEGKTQTEVADMIGISQAQVSRLEKNALKAMRAILPPEIRSVESLYHMMQQPENHIPDHSPQHIGQDIVHLKISPAGDQLGRLHTEAGHECRKGIPKKTPKPRKCPGTDKSIGNKQQYIFHDIRMVPRIRPPGREQFQIHADPAAILSGEKSDHQNDHQIQRKCHESRHGKSILPLTLPSGIQSVQEQSHNSTRHDPIGKIGQGLL